MMFIGGVVTGIFVFLVLTTLNGQPPIHCRYMVPATNHPGVYACSEYPRPKKTTP